MHALQAIGDIVVTLPRRNVMEETDAVPRDLAALIVLHALLSNVNDHGIDKAIAAKYADIAFVIADSMIERGEK